MSIDPRYILGAFAIILMLLVIVLGVLNFVLKI